MSSGNHSWKHRNKVKRSCTKAGGHRPKRENAQSGKQSWFAGRAKKAVKEVFSAVFKPPPEHRV